MFVTKNSSGKTPPEVNANDLDTTNDPKFKRIKPELATWRDYLGAMAGGFGNGWNAGVATADYKIGQAYAWITGGEVSPWLQEWYDKASRDSGLGEGTKYATQCFANVGLGAFGSAFALNVLAVAGVTDIGYATSVRGAYYILWEEACIVGGTGTLFPAAYIRNSQNFVVDPNKLNHIFGNPEHKLQPLVTRAGSETQAFQEVQHAITNRINSSGITGIFEEVVTVREMNITVRGIVTPDGIKIGTFWN